MIKNLNKKVSLILLSVLMVLFLSYGCGSDSPSVQGVNYNKVSDVYGTIKVSGSSTMTNLMSIWCSGFSDIYHNTNCIVESFGSQKAPQDLLNGNADFGAMSEPMSAQDKQAFKSTFGYEPLEIKVAIDMIAVLVNIENPLDCITIDQLDGVYSSTYSCKGSENITKWGDLNLSNEWVTTSIEAYGRTPASGTYDVFKEIALCGGEYKKTISELASARDIVDFVSSDTSSIGYSGAGLLTSGVKALSVGESKSNCYSPVTKNAVSNKYPFTRNLYIYPKGNPSQGMKKLTKEFLKYILSKKGQEAVIEAGLITLPVNTVNVERKKLSQ